MLHKKLLQPASQIANPCLVLASIYSQEVFVVFVEWTATTQQNKMGKKHQHIADEKQHKNKFN